MWLETTQHCIMPSDVLEYCYCPRFIFFERVMMIPEHQELRHKVLEGRETHKRKMLQNPDYLRKKIAVIEKKTDVWMSSKKLPLRGRVDEVLFLADGTAAPLDYKFAEWKGRVFFNHKMQSALYGILISENFGRAVTRGYLVFTRSRNHVEEVRLGETEFARAEEIVWDILEVIRRGKFPARTRWVARCADCCYKNICVR